MILRKVVLISARWLVHGIFFQRLDLLLNKKRVQKRLNDQALQEFHLMKDAYALNQKTREKKIIVSLTTIPSRIDKVILVISRMMNQTILPDKIILCLDKTRKEDIVFSEDLNILIKNGLEIKWVEDVGPHTKYLYATQKYHDDIVITVDDDIIYSHRLLETLLRSYEKYPKAVSANIVTRFVVKNGKIQASSQWLQQFKYGIGDANSVAYGVGGVLYPPNILPKEAFDIKRIIKTSKFQDDLWLKAIELKYEIDVVKAQGSDRLFGYFVTVDGSQGESLRDTNDFKDRNIEYLNKLINEFGLDI
ncbi:hypothetical protein G15_0608 [Enterococcus avium]|nr:hypothetical protein G15_0608 [Enterococcus avium]